MSFYFDVSQMWSEGIYGGPHSFPQSLFRLTLRGRGGLLSFGVNLTYVRVLGILSVHAFVGFRAKVHTSEFICVFKQPTSSVVFRRFKYHQLVQFFLLNMSSSSATNNIVNGSSRNAPKSARGKAPPPAIFPNVITSPGSPPGNQPPVTHTILQAFTKR